MASSASSSKILIISRSSSSWARVAQGFHLVASAAADRTASRITTTSHAVTTHGLDLAQKMRALSVILEERTYDLTLSRQQPPRQNQQQQQQTKSSWQETVTTKEKEVQTVIRKENEELMPQSKKQQQQSQSSLTLEKMTSNGEEDVMKQKTQDTASPTLQATNETTNSTPSNDKNNNNNTTTSTPPLPTSRIPTTRLSRALSFTSLALRLGASTATSLLSTRSTSPLVVHADTLATHLCRMRGAALKLGQMLSLQDESLLPAPLASALSKVRGGADAMPLEQLMEQLNNSLGENKNWQSLVTDFDERPLAAASIGQVHRATYNGQPVVLKVQYPGVAASIESDLRNLGLLVTMTGLAPKGLFIDNVMRVGRDELIRECDYLIEAENQKRMKAHVERDETLKHLFIVPEVIEELTTQNVITSAYCPGVTVDKTAHLLSQDERNRIARGVLRLTMKELFVWRFMQTDPNWSNFLYDEDTKKVALIDFGAAREYSPDFVKGYLKIVVAAADRDEITLMEESHRMGFLTGQEEDVMLNAHKMAGFTIGEPFRGTSDNAGVGQVFDFRGSTISQRIGDHSRPFLTHRLTPPPEEVYTLHRKIAGAYNLCIKLGAVIHCRDILEEVIDYHKHHSLEDVRNDGQATARTVAAAAAVVNDADSFTKGVHV